MGSLESAVDETFLVDVRALPDEALKANIERRRRNAGSTAWSRSANAP
jgi:hypothetical protein